MLVPVTSIRYYCDHKYIIICSDYYMHSCMYTVFTCIYIWYKSPTTLKSHACHMRVVFVSHACCLNCGVGYTRVCLHTHKAFTRGCFLLVSHKIYILQSSYFVSVLQILVWQDWASDYAVSRAKYRGPIFS